MALAKLRSKDHGFTFLEVLLVVGIIAIIAGIVIIALNPGKDLADSRNSQRRSDVSTILNAVYQYSLDNDGAIPAGITTKATEICATGASNCTGLANISEISNNEKYVTSIPEDPQCSTVCSANGVGYEIQKTTNNRITVSAPDAEQGETISVTR